jgi:hypothetical protein
VSAPTRRHRQQLAVATLANLLTLPAPEMSRWVVDYDATIDGLAQGTSLDRTRIDFHAWAAVLDDAVWGLKDLRDPEETDRYLSLTGAYQGVRVHLWNLLPVPDGVTVEELSAPPQVDAPAAVDARTGTACDAGAPPETSDILRTAIRVMQTQRGDIGPVAAIRIAAGPGRERWEVAEPILAWLAARLGCGDVQGLERWAIRAGAPEVLAALVGAAAAAELAVEDATALTEVGA